MEKKIKIMDVTLRDGSYAIDFRFSNTDLKVIGRELEKLKYEYIEIGHGMGIGASSLKNGLALHTDEEYLSAAQQNLKEIKYGMFAIPEVASLEDIEKLAYYGASFVRIGTNVTEVEKSKQYIEKAKSLGLVVMANYMKSYALCPSAFAEAIKKSESYGADVVYIVDSAGSMLPDNIEEYYNAIRRVSNIELGFHAHNNLGLALWNSIYAAKLGINFIDCSLQGLGRSAGNASLELFTILAMKEGLIEEKNYKKLLVFSKRYIQPLLSNKGINPIDVMCGAASFHSSYLNTIHKVSGKYGVNPLELIEEYAKYDQVGMNEEKLDAIANGLKEDLHAFCDVDFLNYFGNEQEEK